MSSRRQKRRQATAESMSLKSLCITAIATVIAAVVTAAGNGFSVVATEWQVNAQDKVQRLDTYSTFFAREERFSRQLILSLLVVSQPRARMV